MPQNRKPEGTRQDNAPSRALASVTQIAGRQPAADAPHPAPRGLLKQTHEQWEDFWQADSSQVIARHMLPAVYRLFELRDAQTRALRLYKRRPMTEGSMGQPVVNPAMGTVQALEKDIRALEDRLGLTPKAAANLGIQIGQARLTAAELNRMAEEEEPSDGDAGESDADGRSSDDLVEADGWVEA